jgi:hypothetical protein
VFELAAFFAVVFSRDFASDSFLLRKIFSAAIGSEIRMVLVTQVHFCNLAKELIGSKSLAR